MQKYKEQGGRPEAANPRSEKISARFTKEEASAVKGKAIKTHRSVSSFIVSATTNKKIVYTPRANVIIWRKLAPALSNLNQLAKHVSMGNIRNTHDIPELLKELIDGIHALRLDLANQGYGDAPEDAERPVETD